MKKKTCGKLAFFGTRALSESSVYHKCVKFDASRLPSRTCVSSINLTWGSKTYLLGTVRYRFLCLDSSIFRSSFVLQITFSGFFFYKEISIPYSRARGKLFISRSVEKNITYSLLCLAEFSDDLWPLSIFSSWFWVSFWSVSVGVVKTVYETRVCSWPVPEP